jgi:hypothetical protein
MDLHLKLTEAVFEIELHKQIANRILEPFMWITRVVTGTDVAWANYFHLRCHHAAQSEAAEEAFRSADAYFDSTPRVLDKGDLHLPYVSLTERAALSEADQFICSTARCARISYVRQNEVDYEKERDIYTRLQNPGARPDGFNPDEPVHGSPFDHPATCTGDSEHYGHLQGFKPHRKSIPHEVCRTFTREDLERRRKDRFERFGLR